MPRRCPTSTYAQALRGRHDDDPAAHGSRNPLRPSLRSPPGDRFRRPAAFMSCYRFGDVALTATGRRPDRAALSLSRPGRQIGALLFNGKHPRVAPSPEATVGAGASSTSSFALAFRAKEKLASGEFGPTTGTRLPVQVPRQGNRV